jgi:hypothetical protein
LHVRESGKSRKKEEGRRKKEEGRREGRGKREEGRSSPLSLSFLFHPPSSSFLYLNSTQDTLDLI